MVRKLKLNIIAMHHPTVDGDLHSHRGGELKIYGKEVVALGSVARELLEEIFF